LALAVPLSRFTSRVGGGSAFFVRPPQYAMGSEDYDDPKLEAQWLAKQRDTVQRYLQDEGVRHRGVASDPAWFIAPYVSVWTVESMKTPGAVGWWAISGDLPTDYLSGHDATDARTALAAFAIRWREVSGYMLRGEKHPTVNIGPPDKRGEFGDLLSRRADIIEEWTNDDEMW
jgi:hypothetical protein